MNEDSTDVRRHSLISINVSWSRRIYWLNNTRNRRQKAR